MMRLSSLKFLGLVTQVGLTIVIAILLGAVIGSYLDRLLGTTFLILLFILFGAVSGVVSVFQLITKLFMDDGDKDD